MSGSGPRPPLVDRDEAASAGPAVAPLRNIISVDVEDWFQVENYAKIIPREEWPEQPLRVLDSVDLLLDLFARKSVHATFFILGWLAERESDMVRRIADAGHEIASHGWSHRPIWNLEPKQFTEEIRRSRRLLQDLSGQAVVGYRAPTFSITRKTEWALRNLAEEGYRYDSSIFPVRHDRYGIPDAPLEIHRREEGIWEIPMSVLELPRLRLPVAGGGYLRLFPRALTSLAVRRMNRAGRPAVIYVHPWEFDPGQPRCPGAGFLKSLRHRVGIAGNEAKLGRLLDSFPFGPARDVVPEGDADPGLGGPPPVGGRRVEV